MLVVGTKLCQHVLRSYEFFVVVFQALVPCNVADRSESGSADLARSFRDIVSHGEDLLAMLIQQQMVITKVSPTHVPVEILRFQIKCEHIG